MHCAHTSGRDGSRRIRRIFHRRQFVLQALVRPAALPESLQDSIARWQCSERERDNGPNIQGQMRRRKRGSSRNSLAVDRQGD